MDTQIEELLEGVDVKKAQTTADDHLKGIAHRDGLVAGMRMAAYWTQLTAAGIPLHVAGGLIMQYQAVVLGSMMPLQPQRVDVRHWSGDVGYEED